MRQNIYRSENLLITLCEDERQLEFEIRFSTSYARGRCDATCPRCHKPVSPSRWEIEGPEGLGNTVWFTCGSSSQGGAGCDDLRWTRRVDFPDGWVDTED